MPCASNSRTRRKAVLRSSPLGGNPREPWGVRARAIERGDRPRLALTPGISRCKREPMHRDLLIRILRERSLFHAPPGKPFILASGRTSNTYLDVRRTSLSPEGHVLLGEMMFAAVQKIGGVEGVAGVELGGCPLASAVSMFSAQIARYGGPRPLEALYVRKAAKEHGAKNLVEGTKHPAMPVALLEDVVTSGGSSLRAIEALHNEGVTVKAVIAVVDRLEGGSEALTKAGLPFIALTTLPDVLGERA